MAKKAPLLGKNYNPIGSRLKKFSNQTQSGKESKISKLEAGKEDVKEKSRLSIPELKRTEQVPIIKPEEEALLEKDTKVFLGDLPIEEEGKRTELKFRCTASERDRWHEFSEKVTGRRNKLSNVMRSLLLLLEHSEGQIEALGTSLKDVKPPPKGDALKTVLYEKKIASVLWEAIRRASKP